MGIIVRNGIIMIDYAEELRNTENYVYVMLFIILHADACDRFPDFRSSFYGSHSDDFGQKWIVDAYGNRYLLRNSYHHDLPADRSSGSVHAIV